MSKHHGHDRLRKVSTATAGAILVGGMLVPAAAAAPTTVASANPVVKSNVSAKSAATSSVKKEASDDESAESPTATEQIDGSDEVPEVSVETVAPVEIARATAAPVEVEMWSVDTNPGLVVGKKYEDYVYGSANNGSKVTFSVSGKLPDGIQFIPSTGKFAGTPTKVGSYSFQLTATADGVSETVKLLWNVGPVEVEMWSVDTSPGLVVGKKYEDYVYGSANNGAGVTFSVSGKLPDGIQFIPSTGKFAGTPTKVGSYSFQLTATADGVSETVKLLWNVGPVEVEMWSVDTSPGLVVGKKYEDYVYGSANNGAGVTFSVSGKLPDGIQFIPSTGKFTGTPTKAGTYIFQISVTADGALDTVTLTWTVAGPPVEAKIPTSVPMSVAGQATSIVIPKALVNGSETTSYNVTYSVSGLPTGLKFDASTRAVSGIPTRAGTFTVGIIANAGGETSDKATFTWTVNPATIVPAVPTTVPNVVAGKSAKVTLPVAKVNGSTTSPLPVTYTVTAPAWAGLSFNPETRVITVTPTKAGTIPVRVVAKAGGAASAPVTFNWTVTKPTVEARVPATLPAAVVGKVARATLPNAKVNGSVNSPVPVTYNVTAPAWAGLSYDASVRRITVTPTKAGIIPIRVVAIAAGTASAPVTFNWTVTK